MTVTPVVTGWYWTAAVVVLQSRCIMGTWSESNSTDSLGTAVRRNFWLKAKVKVCHPNVSIWEQTGAGIYFPSSHRRLLASQRRGAVVYRRSRGGTEALTEGPCRLRLSGVRLHSLRSACQQLHNPITSSTTSLECWIMITIQNDNMQREAAREWKQVSDVWKVWEQQRAAGETGGRANHPGRRYF